MTNSKMNISNLSQLAGITIVLAIAAVGCGRGNNNGNNQALVGNCPVGQQWNGAQCVASNWNNQFGPGVNGPVFQGFNCQQGQVRLAGRCYMAQTIGHACSMAGGQLIAQNICKTERIVNRINASYISYTFGRMAGRTIPLNGLRAGESIRVTGTVSTRRYSNPWSLAIVQQDNGFNVVDPFAAGGYGPVVLASTSSSEESYYNDDNVNLTAHVGGQQMVNNNNNVGPWMNTSMPARLALYIEAKNTVYVDLRISAASCEDGSGNSYPCP